MASKATLTQSSRAQGQSRLWGSIIPSVWAVEQKPRVTFGASPAPSPASRTIMRCPCLLRPRHPKEPHSPPGIPRQSQEIPRHGSSDTFCYNFSRASVTNRNVSSHSFGGQKSKLSFKLSAWLCSLCSLQKRVLPGLSQLLTTRAVQSQLAATSLPSPLASSCGMLPATLCLLKAVSLLKCQ